jgi:hypothetical protein
MTSHQLQPARSTLAECARWLVGGRISNYEFDDAVPSAPDPAVSAIYEYFWMLYCDMREYRLTGPDELSPLERDKAAIACFPEIEAWWASGAEGKHIRCNK